MFCGPPAGRRLALALCHELIDRRGWPAIGRSLGVNAIAVYAGSARADLCADRAWVGSSRCTRECFARWMTPRFGPYVASLAWALAFTACWWLVAWGLDRRRVYLKI